MCRSPQPSVSAVPCRGHISLFRHDFAELIDADFLDWIDGSNAIFGDKGARIREVLRYDGEISRKMEKKAKAIEFVFDQLTREPIHRQKLTNYFLLKSDDVLAKKELLMEGLHDESRNLLQKYFYDRSVKDSTAPSEEGSTVAEFLARFLRPDELLEELYQSHGNLYQPLLDELLPLTTAELSAKELEELKIKQEAEKENEGTARAKKFESTKTRESSDFVARLLLRRLPRFEATSESGEWFYHLLAALSRNRYHSFLPEYIDPDFQDLLDKQEAEKRAREVQEALGGRSSDDYDIDESESDTFRPQKDFVAYRAKLWEGVTIPPPMEIDLRPYQQELVEELAPERNGIVCAPTGSGKTVVASYLILEHLKAAEGRRVAVFVPKVPLVEQQMITFLTYMRSLYNITCFSGTETSKGRGFEALANDVVVLTPQIFVNMLNSPKRSDHLNVSDFTMLVFDECHYCQGDHPYKVIMDIVNESVGPKPRVVGLTASVGVGRNPTMDKAIEHILKLCVNLNADKIASVQQHKEDLLARVRPPVDEIERVNRNLESKVLTLLQDCLHGWHTEFASLVESLVSKELLSQDLSKQMREPKQGDMDAYLNYIGSVEQGLRAQATFPEKAQSLKIVDFLKAFLVAEEYADLLPNDFALKHLSRQWKLLKVSAESEDVATKEVFDRFTFDVQELHHLHKKEKKDCQEDKEILNKLRSLLKEQFSQNPESRAIVFVQKRFVAEALCRHLNAVCDFFGNSHSVGYITSSSASLAKGGQTAGIQRDMLDSFNHGSVKVLVATSVVEEGIDVKACQLIIKYNTSSSGISLTQRKGRARAAGSRAILLALSGATESQEMQAVQEALLMEQCLKDLRASGDVALLRRIAAKRQEMDLERETKRKTQEANEKELRDKELAFHCFLCDQLICTSRMVRKMVEHTENRSDTAYVVADPKLWAKVELLPEDTPKRHHDAIKVGTYRCRHCQSSEVLGMLLAFADLLVPTLRFKALIVKDLSGSGESNDRKGNARWEFVSKRCLLERTKGSEMRAMHRAFIEQFPSKVALMEELAEAGRIVAARKLLDSHEKLKEKRQKQKRVAAETKQRLDELDKNLFKEYVEDGLAQ